MVSAAEGSTASLSLRGIAKLHEEALLQKKAAIYEQPKAATLTTEAVVSTSHSSHVKSVVPQRTNACIASTSSPTDRPRLSASKSASAVEMEDLVQPLSSQEAFTAMTRASSFHGFPGGDTQPLESQVWRDYQQEKANPTLETPKKTILKVHKDAAGKTFYDIVAVCKSPEPDVQNGFVDLSRPWHPSSPGTRSSSPDIDEIMASTQSQQRRAQEKLEEELERQRLRETPPLAGHKRNSSGEVLTSPSTTKKTPGFSQLFNGVAQKGNMLSATQLFNHTQAPSSPLPNGPRSDPIISRPSPTVQNQFSVSSPTVVMSSPVGVMHSRPSTACDPRDRYTSIGESQQRRAARLREELGLHFEDGRAQEDDEEQDMEQSKVDQTRRQRAVSEQAVSEWTKLRVVSQRPSSRLSSRLLSSPQHRQTIDLVTPATSKHTHLEFQVSDDGGVEPNLLATEDEHAGDGQHSDDEYDELGQTILRSQDNQYEEDNEMRRKDHEHREKRVNEQSGLQDHELLNTRSRGQPGQQHEPLGKIVSAGSQHSAVADSQPRRRRLPTQSQDSRHRAIMAEINASTTQPLENGDHSAYRISSSPPFDSASPTPETSTSRSNGKEPIIRSATETDYATEKVIPESDLPEAYKPSSPAPVVNRVQRQVIEQPQFYCAPTYKPAFSPLNQAPGLPFIPMIPWADRYYKSCMMQSPRKDAGVRNFAEVGTQDSTPQASNETDLDIDALMSDVVTVDDQTFMRAVTSPTRERSEKRRRVVYLEPSASTSPPKRRVFDVRKRFTDDQQRREHDVVVKRKVTNDKETSRKKVQTTSHKTRTVHATTPPRDERPKSTPDSVKKREKAGANAASKVLSKRAAVPAKPAKPTTGRKETGPTVEDHTATSHPAGQASKKADQRATVSSKPQKHVHEPPVDGGKKKIVKPPVETDRASEKRKEQDGAETKDGNDRRRKTHESSKITAPARVFALFKGSLNNFYSATWLGTTPDGLNYRVKFDDGTTTNIDTQHVRRLELRVGDAVKVDVGGLRNKTWLVEYFLNVAGDESEQRRGTDIYGHLSVKLKAKDTRNSLSESGTPPSTQSDHVTAYINKVYITRTMWPRYVDRAFTPPALPITDRARLVTPTTGGAKVEADLSASRTGRTLIPTSKAMGGRLSHQRDASVVSATTPTRIGLFSGMAFAISYGSKEAEKNDITSLIRRQGGLILENGFDELFDLPSLNGSAPTSPKRPSPGKVDKAELSANGLRLKPEFAQLGFVALIADKHSRRAKYMQALALGLPTLSGRWIEDSLDPAKNCTVSNPDATTLPWAKYLLPAGESTYLGGAIRSRTISLYNAAEAHLAQQVEKRDMLLNGEGVLIVASTKGKASWERRKAYAFLTLAIGAGRVKRVSDLTETKAFVTNEPQTWKWVYVDSDVAEASSMLGKAGGENKKRKRDDGVAVDMKALCAAEGDVKIVNDEFVVQSLILGALME